jgi:putative peptidoglycan lipid II flippase
MASVLGDRAAPADDVFALGGGERQKRRPRWLALALPVGAGLVVLALLGWLVGSALGGLPGLDGGGDGSTNAAPPPSSGRSVAPLVPVKPDGSALYDPDGDGQEAGGISAATDGDPSTSWRTAHYNHTSAFGGLKPGIGIAYDFGKPTALRQIAVTTDRPGIQVQIRAGNDRDAANPDDYQVVGPTRTLKTADTFSIRSGTSARYYIVWLTQLTSDTDGKFVGSLSEVAFRR